MIDILSLSPDELRKTVQELKHIVKIVHGLSDPHQDNVGNSVSCFLLREQNLIQHLTWCEIAYQSADGGRAEAAALAAADLTGNTN